MVVHQKNVLIEQKNLGYPVYYGGALHRVRTQEAGQMYEMAGACSNKTHVCITVRR